MQVELQNALAVKQLYQRGSNATNVKAGILSETRGGDGSPPVASVPAMRKKIKILGK
jgi:hypothetical protein